MSRRQCLHGAGVGSTGTDCSAAITTTHQPVEANAPRADRQVESLSREARGIKKSPWKSSNRKPGHCLDGLRGSMETTGKGPAASRAGHRKSFRRSQGACAVGAKGLTERRWSPRRRGGRVRGRKSIGRNEHWKLPSLVKDLLPLIQGPHPG